MSFFSDKDRLNWKQSKGEGFPNGDYTAILKSGEFKRNKEGIVKLLVRFDVMTPVLGEEYVRVMNVSDQKQMYWTCQDLIKLGVNVDCELDDLPNEIKKCAGKEVSFTLSQEGKYQNFVIHTAKDPVSYNQEKDDVNF